MRLSRWGRSEYETDADIATEAGLLSAHVTVRGPGKDAEIIVVTSKEPMGAGLRLKAPSVCLLLTTTSGTDHLDLVLAKGYLARLLGNARVVRYLAQHHQEFLSEFQKIAEMERTAA